MTTLKFGGFGTELAVLTETLSYHVGWKTGLRSKAQIFPKFYPCSHFEKGDKIHDMKVYIQYIEQREKYQNNEKRISQIERKRKLNIAEIILLKN